MARRVLPPRAAGRLAVLSTLIIAASGSHFAPEVVGMFGLRSTVAWYGCCSTASLALAVLFRWRRVGTILSAYGFVLVLVIPFLHAPFGMLPGTGFVWAYHQWGVAYVTSRAEAWPMLWLLRVLPWAPVTRRLDLLARQNCPLLYEDLVVAVGARRRLLRGRTLSSEPDMCSGIDPYSPQSAPEPPQPDHFLSSDGTLCIPVEEFAPRPGAPPPPGGDARTTSRATSACTDIWSPGPSLSGLRTSTQRVRAGGAQLWRQFPPGPWRKGARRFYMQGQLLHAEVQRSDGAWVEACKVAVPGVRLEVTPSGELREIPDILRRTQDHPVRQPEPSVSLLEVVRSKASFAAAEEPDAFSDTPEAAEAGFWLSGVMGWPGSNISAHAVERLLSLGGDPDSVDHRGIGALHWAAALGREHNVAMLLKAKADPNLQDHEGSTPLHDLARSAAYLKPDVVRRLLTMLRDEYRADPSIVDELDCTPCDDAADGAARELLAPIAAFADLEAVLVQDGDGAVTRAVFDFWMRHRPSAVKRADAGRQQDAEEILRYFQVSDLVQGQIPRAAALYRCIVDVLLDRAALDGTCLDRQDKALLHHILENTKCPIASRRTRSRLIGARSPPATPTSSTPDCDPRDAYRNDFQRRLNSVMRAFGKCARKAYEELVDASWEIPGLDNIIDGPVDHVFAELHTELRPGGKVTWAVALDNPGWVVARDLRGAYQDLLRVGSIRTMEEFCRLLQTGSHRYFVKNAPFVFSNVRSAEYWSALYLLFLLGVADLLNESFHKFMAALFPSEYGYGRHSSAMSVQCGPKKFERCRDKIVQEISEASLATFESQVLSPGRLLDLVRCSLVCSPLRLFEIESQISTMTLWPGQTGITPVRRKNTLSAQLPSTRIRGGYRDLKYNVVFHCENTGLSCVAEIQLLTPAFLKLKKRMHGVYRIDRGDYEIAPVQLRLSRSRNTVESIDEEPFGR
eukprot:CAMPEP_0204256226 /NCGR_PEP_ID=MMETSP0468-20130131/3653_1 /ASSEMBLY_ACC=CAM_ASM_000383 /TAXON_ID=2969 /ORGANISM="Oxyrrhis marina" /LENGTH=963 /DNA_ID=CAMNT_0051230163 /DNA_START=70 /DNA_END=2961 /DNA_ORIENTATION=-